MDFMENLQEGVMDAEKLSTKNLEDEKNQIIAELELRKTIDTNPKETKEMKKRLAEIEKELNNIYEGSLEVKSEVTTEQDEGILDDINKAVEEKEKHEEEKENNKVVNGDESIVPSLAEEELPEEESNKKELEDEQALKEAYYNALIDLYNKKIEVVNKQKEKHQLVSSRADFDAENKLEAAMYAARDRYMAIGKEDPYEFKRTELIEKDRKAREPIEMELRVKADKYRKLEEELRKIEEEEEKLNKKLLDLDLTEEDVEQIKERQEELRGKKERIDLELTEVKDALNDAIEIRRGRAAEKAGLTNEHVKTLTTEDMRSYRYQQSKIGVMNNNVKKANKQENENIRNRIIERVNKIKYINEQLYNLKDDTDFETRLALLEQLDREVSMLEADRQAEFDLDRGIELSEDKAKKEVYSNEEKEEDRQKDFKIDTEEAREAIYEVQKAEERGVLNPVINPTSLLKDEKDIQIESREETLDEFEEPTGFSDPFRAELNGKVERIKDEASAQRYLDVVEADAELDKVTERIQEEI